jgi:transposase-like protein
MSEEKRKPRNIQEVMPSAEEVQRELGKAKSMDDFFGKEGIFAKLFAHTIEEMLETELSEHLGYEAYEVKGRNSGNSRNGRYGKKLRTSAGETNIQVPRDRNGEFEPQVVKKQVANTNELEDKIIGMYAKGMSVRDIQETLKELYGVDVSPATLSAITDKVWGLVEEWQNRSLAGIYPIVYLDAIHIKLRHEGKVENIAVYTVLGVDLEGQRDILGHWVGNGSESSNFWLSVITDLQTRGVQDIFIACMDQIRNSLKYITWTDRKAFMVDLKTVYQAATRESAEANLRQLSEKWGDKYAVAIRSWQNNWEDLSTFFAYPAEIRRLIYTNNSVEGYHRQLRKVTKAKSIFPTPEAARKLLFLANRDILKKWSKPIPNWPLILNQLVIRFEGRLAI